MRHLPILLLLGCGSAYAQTSPPPLPQPLPLPPALPQPRDVKFPGTITLAVDATDTDRHVFSVHETVPVSRPGDLILLYPEYIPGDHGPTGPIRLFAGLTVTANGAPLTWVRDAVQPRAFHIRVPKGATSVDLTYQYLSPATSREGRVEMTPNMLDLEWNEVTLYPAGYFARDIGVKPSVTLPDGWKFGTALDGPIAPGDAVPGGKVSFDPVTLNVLLDSPLYAGRYYERVDLNPGGTVPVHLDVVADRPQDLVISAKDLAAHRALVQQAFKNFGSHHFNHYDFLFSLSDEMGGEGLEHHRSSEDGTGRDYFTDAAKSLADRDLLPHEFTHSWNGKFRRPADLWSPDFVVLPERDSLLWVYEGQTQYWGQVYAARSGIETAANQRDDLAMEAASMENVVGRSWRDLEDTTNDPLFSLRRPIPWRNWQRDEDYYVEGLLTWLDADTLIREKTSGKKSLDDFARAFFGVDDGQWGVLPYQFKDVVAGLNAVVPYDWAGFLNDHLHTHDATHLLDGITRGGWKLVYTDKPSAYEKSAMGRFGGSEFAYSLGIVVGKGGTLAAVSWGSPAFKAGLVEGGKIIAVNGLAYDSPSDISDAIKQAQTGNSPVTLLLRYGNHFRTVAIDYHGGLRYPHLERIPGTPDRLDAILAPLA